MLDALLDDLNTPKAIAELHKLHSAGHWGALRNALQFLGFSCDRANAGRTACMPAKALATQRQRGEAVGERIEARNAARKAKNFAEADRIRDELERWASR